MGRVLDCLGEAGLKVKASKCQFGRKCMLYLGHQIGGAMLSVPAARVEAMRSYQRPITKRQLQAFLGAIGYYRDFIPSFAVRSCRLSPSTSLTAPHKVAWTEGMTGSFRKIIELLCNCVVVCPNPD